MPSSQTEAIRTAIQEFLDDRYQTKVDALKESDPDYSEKKQTLQEKFRATEWIEDAARRVTQLQVVTHSLKPIHPDARGTNLYREPADLPAHDLIGSHLLAPGFQEDVVGNAAALDVYKFLKIEHQGRTLLQRALDFDPALIEALDKDPERSGSWVKAFASIIKPKEEQSTDTLAKQIFWLVGDDPTLDENYHLLAPLHATSLTHVVFRKVTNDRFSESGREAMKARREKRFSENEYRVYPDLSVQKMGGTKPQNISQLNSERGGRNYLLASLPPLWTSREVRPLLRVESAFDVFGRQQSVRKTVTSLRKLLEAEPRPNRETRTRRDALVAEIIDELMLLQMRLTSLEGGWTLNPACHLMQAQCLWLDPGRAAVDEEFARLREQKDWEKEVCHQFGNWLNHRKQLGNRLPLGDPEHAHWTDLLKEIMCHD